MAYALKFTAPYSTGQLGQALDRIGPWRWRSSDSDQYGEILWTVTDEGIDLTIFGKKPSWIVQVGVSLDDDAGRAAIDRVLTERVFPALSATDVEETETVR